MINPTPIRREPPELFIEPEGAHDGQPARLVTQTGTRRIEVRGVYRRCRICKAPALDPCPQGWTVAVYHPDDDEQFLDGLWPFDDRLAADPPPPYALTPHRPGCSRTLPPPAPERNTIMPSNPPASDHNPPGRVLIGPPGADPAHGGLVDVGHTSRGISDTRDGISDTLERLALHLNQARTAFIVAMRPAVARALGFLAAARRAIAARRPRPARRPAHLHHTRTAYRHRQ